MLVLSGSNSNIFSLKLCDNCASTYTQAEHAPTTTTCVIGQGGRVIACRMKPDCTAVRILPLLILDSPCAVSPTSQRNYHFHVLKDDPDTDGYLLGGTSEHRKSWQLSGNAEAILQPPSGLPAKYSGYTTTSRRWRTDRRRTMHVTAMTAEVISTVLRLSLSWPDWRRETCKVRHDEKDGATSAG